ncbi:MAG: hypothetical protein A4E41_00055 [Methanoregulaceae archaeon PtaU1.Bin066]|nr:MAG: hypothetical protein A4E41_00055 [Methanoregulaceae archaeon PtaU1.Bin066]
MSLEVLKLIAKDKQIFTTNDLYEKTKRNKEVLNVVLSRLENKGYIEKIQKGKYLIIPLNSEKGKYTLHEFIIGSSIVTPSAISYWSALNYHGLTEQIPSTVFIQTTKRKNKQIVEIFGIKYQIVRVKEEKFFGQKKEWIEDIPIMITDKEKTIIDCLDMPQYSGGIIEVAKAIKYNSLDYELISDYAQKIGNIAVIRRLGYFFDLMDMQHNLPLPKSKKYLRLDPTMPISGNNNPKWKLIINIDDTIKEELE